jgi:hypothetical protein
MSRLGSAERPTKPGHRRLQLYQILPILSYTD